MAGLGAKLFTAFSKLTAAQVNGYLMDQTIMRFASTAARDAAFGGAGEPTLAEGMTCYLDDTNVVQSYNGSAWVSIAASSVVPGVTSGMTLVAPTSVAGTGVTLSGAVTTITANTTSASINGVFTSAYTNYCAIITGSASTDSDGLDRKSVV